MKPFPLHYSLVSLAVCLTAARVAAYIIIAPTNTMIEYTGRFDGRTPAQPAFDWPASTVRLRFTGTSIGVMLHNTETNYRFRAFIDGSAVPDILCTTAGSNTYWIATGLAAGEHTLELVKKNEEDWSLPVTRLLGFLLDDGAGVLPLAPTARKMLFIGDSFTVGYGAAFVGAARSSASHTEKLTNDDAWISYGMQLARHYQAQAQIIARSGIGVYCLNNTIETNGSMRTRFRQALFADAGYYYSPAQWAPHMIVVALGINDFATWSKTSTPTQAQFEGAYHELLTMVTSWYPQATIALATFGSTQPWHAYVSNVAAAHGYAYTNVPLTTAQLGLDWHPNAAGHSNIAAVLKTLINTLPVAWPGASATDGRILIDVGDSATPTTGGTPYWNNVTTFNGGSPAIPYTYYNLVTVSNLPTGINLIMSNWFAGYNTAGTTSGAFDYPGSATRDNAFTGFGAGATDATGYVYFTALDINKIYSFTFFASRMGASDNRETRYELTGANSATVALNPANNSSQRAVSGGIYPDSNGQIHLLVGPGPNNNNASRFCYLGVIDISIIPEPAGALAALLLVLIPIMRGR